MSRRALRTGLAFGAICAVAGLAYAPSFGVPFQFDDYARLGQNRPLAEGGWFAALHWLGTSRVVPALTLVLNYRLGGFAPFGFHVLNFAVHLLTTLGVFALALALCRAPRLRQAWPPDRAFLLASAAALLFACHPLQTQAVTYIIQRYASIAALFYVWAVVCYLRARTRQPGVDAGSPTPYFVAMAVFAVCAVLSKENAASLPLALLLAEWVGFGWPGRRRAIALAAVLPLLLAAVPLGWKAAFFTPRAGGDSLLTLIWRGDISIFASGSASLGGPTTVLDYLFTQATVLPRYLRLVVLPWGQNIDHDVPIAAPLSAPVLAGFAFLAALAGLGLSQMQRRPLLAFAILWFFITLSVESTVVVIGDVMAEHRMYLPMAGLALGGGWVFAVAAARAPRGALAAGAALAAGLVALTFARNVVWLSPVTLWLDAVEKSPRKSRPQVNAGVWYHQVGRLEEAAHHYCRALALDPADDVARDNLAIVLDELRELDATSNAKAGVVHADGSTLVIDDVASYCPEAK